MTNKHGMHVRTSTPYHSGTTEGKDDDTASPSPFFLSPPLWHLFPEGDAQASQQQEIRETERMKPHTKRRIFTTGEACRKPLSEPEWLTDCGPPAAELHLAVWPAVCRRPDL